MISRYAHDAITTLWSPEWTYNAWLKIEQEVARTQADLTLLPEEHALAITRVGPVTDWDIVGIEAIEAKTKHDVAAFLEWLRIKVATAGVGTDVSAPFVHFGLTSSDLVDTAQAMRFQTVLPVLHGEMSQLIKAIAHAEGDETWVLGRTHGQPAEPMQMRVRVAHWGELISETGVFLLRATKAMNRGKLSGPVGTYAHNPPEVESMVMSRLGLVAQAHGSSQIVPRAALAAWANCAAAAVQACAKIAMDLRLMNMLDEVRVPFEEGQVGSSSMAHKRNPIEAEQITGLARVAQGYATMLQPLDAWLERDISHSSVERIAVPDLWHILLRVIKLTTRLLDGMRVSSNAAFDNIRLAGGAPWVAQLTNIGIAKQGRLWEDARDWASRNQLSVTADRLDWFMRNYPWTCQPGKGDGTMSDHERS